jgi:membrane fusion protein (multidrug efflux system)
MIMVSVLRLFAVCLLALLSTVVTARGAGYGDLEGLIEPSELVEVSSQVPGVLEEVTVERGDRVEKDQVLARLKSGVENAAVALARASVEFGRRKGERNEELYRKQLISIHDKDELETEVLISELQLREASERLELRTIRSPIQGVVVKRSREKGEYVGEGPIMTVARIDPLHVEVIVPVERLGTVRKGMRAQVRPCSPVGGVYTAKVVIVDQVVDAASGTFGVRLELPNPSYRLPAGVRCKVRFLHN